MESRTACICSLCETEAPAGSILWPWERSRRRWAHMRCVEAATPPEQLPLVPPPCKHWMRKGRCMLGDACFFRHPEALRASEASAAASTSATTPPQQSPALIKVDRNGEPLSTPRQNRGAGRRNKVRNNHRVSVFRQLLLRVFGVERMRSGTGVLDIAGGKGELSFELTQLNGVPATVIDPRQLALATFERRKDSGWYASSAFARLDQNASGLDDNGAFPPPAPLQHLRVLFQLPRFNPTWPLVLMNAEAFDEARGAAQKLVWDSAGLHEHRSKTQVEEGCKAAPAQKTTDNTPDSDLLELFQQLQAASEEDTAQAGSAAETQAPPPPHPKTAISEAAAAAKAAVRQRRRQHKLQREQAEAASAAASATDTRSRTPVTVIDDFATAQQLLTHCAILVGMHPDQGAEPLVDFALAHNKPFAVVPCCVYVKEAPWRKLPNGTPVRSYSQLVDYLAAKDPGIQRATLDFEGKNQCLYWLGRGREEEEVVAVSKD